MPRFASTIFHPFLSSLPYTTDTFHPCTCLQRSSPFPITQEQSSR